MDLSKVKQFKIIMTKQCNMNCIYCIQKGNREYSKLFEEVNINKLIKIFPNKGIYEIIFFGGEPLLKFNYIQQIVELLSKKNSNVIYTIITNGQLLDLDKVLFFNKFNFHIVISHDGYCYKKTRSIIDPLENNGKIIAKIKKLSFLMTLTSNNWDIYKSFEFFESFRLKHNIPRIRISFQDLRDIDGNINDSLFIYQNKDFEEMLDKLFDNLYLSIKNKIFDSYEFLMFKRPLMNIFYNLNNEYIKNPCSNEKMCIVDLKGNIYNCQNDIYVSSVEKILQNNFPECKLCELKKICPICPKINNKKFKYSCYFNTQVQGRLMKMLNKLIKDGDYNENNDTKAI